MKKNKLTLKIIVFGFLAMQYSFIAQAQDSPKNQMGKNQTNN